MATRKCTKCGQLKPEQEFHVAAWQCRGCKSEYDREYRSKTAAWRRITKRRYAAMPDVKAAKREYDRAYRQKNRDTIDARRARWTQENQEKQRLYALTAAHRRRALTRSGMTAAELSVWVSEQRKSCYWCGSECADRFEIDHYLPISKGGAHDAGNLVISCQPCNRRKQAKLPEEYAAERGRLF